ncbi:iron-containing alcohol dehydrogenase [Thiomicrorhabdus sp. Kp2]|uniref:iron-containing alcohol dehydrogenase n=1 Tax=Thiomicrorhabdus sp. Kp2 TaxID=1123518 RepID=UPI0004211C04|nr:iron-containing alcohol dehydrogenase [Thiomicrorhabdus sp. Kp2]
MTNPITNFEFAPMPHIHFGWGIRHQLIKTLAKQRHTSVVLITGKTIAHPGEFGDELYQKLKLTGLVKHFIISGEPSPDIVDEVVQQCDSDTDIVLGLGGGSVLDAAKAIAGLIPSQTSVMDYLEGVGAGKPFHVETCPFIAIPTTAGTGSETTKNAVLSRIGEFKKSFRDNKLLAKEAWLDPELLTTCPKEVLYSTGMDAFTQLLESYTTLKPNPMTDALAWKGMILFKGAFEDINSSDKKRQQNGYSNLMLAASLSGTTLANAGLGAVHGLAGPIGAFFEAPHGIVCARLLAPITQENILSLQKDTSEHAKLTLKKYQQVSQLFNSELNDEALLPGLVKTLQQYAQQYTPQGLAEFGLTQENISVVIKNCRSGSMLGNSVTLSDHQLRQSIENSL